MAGIWRAVAACSSLASDLQHVGALQHIARCSQLRASNSIITQQPSRQQYSTAAAAAQARESAAAASSGAQSNALSSSSSPSSLQAQAERQGKLSTLLSGQSSKELGAAEIGLYYDFNSGLVPEAFKPFHQAFYSPRPAKLQRKGGCRGLQAEFSSSGSSSLMWRRSSQELAAVLGAGTAGAAGAAATGAAGAAAAAGAAGAGAAAPRVHLQGPVGSGKSVALVQMVEWARSQGWLVLYVPSASELTRGGFFYPRGDGTYDTLISALHILKSMADSHDSQLAGLRIRLEESRDLLASPAAAAAIGSSSSLVGKERDSLRDLINAGLSTDDNGQLAVDCCLLLLRELAAASHEVPVLLALDDYNTLYWRSEYGATRTHTPRGKPAYQFRAELPIKKLNLARGFRLLERRDLGQCRVLVASSCSRQVPEDVAVPNPTGSSYHMPRFSPVETAHALFYYHERGLVPSPPSQQQVAALRALTNGSGAELRRWCVKITQTDMGLL